MPEVNFRCHFSRVICIVFGDTASHWNWSWLIWLNWLVSKPWATLSAFPAIDIINTNCHVHLSMYVLGKECRYSHKHGKCLTDSVFFQTPELFVSYFLTKVQSWIYDKLVRLLNQGSIKLNKMPHKFTPHVSFPEREFNYCLPEFCVYNAFRWMINKSTWVFLWNSLLDPGYREICYQGFCGQKG